MLYCHGHGGFFDERTPHFISHNIKTADGHAATWCDLFRDEAGKSACYPWRPETGYKDGIDVAGVGRASADALEKYNAALAKGALPMKRKVIRKVIPNADSNSKGKPHADFTYEVFE